MNIVTMMPTDGVYGRLLNRIIRADDANTGMRLSVDDAAALAHMVRLEWDSMCETARFMDEDEQ